MILTRTLSVAAMALALAAPPKGIDVDALDRTADPCQDFYAFTSGGWRAAHPLPAGLQLWNRRLAARELNRRQLTALLVELAASTDHKRGSIEQQLGDHFAACMDEAAIDAAGIAPLAPLLADIAGIRDRAGVEAAVRRLHELAVPAPFVLSAAFDYHDPALMIVNIAAGGLGLPDRDSYLKPEPQFADAREAYRARVARVLTLGGMAAGPASQAAADVLALETRLAEASLPPEEAGDPAATSHKVTFAQLATARFDWKGYFAQAGLPLTDVNVASGLPPATGRRARHDASRRVEGVSRPGICSTSRIRAWAARRRRKPARRSAWSRPSPCSESPSAASTANAHSPARGQGARAGDGAQLLAVAQEEVGAITWMAPETRQEALRKLATYDVKVGYPDTWTD